MTERPILFSSPMVRAILDGTKTQTRRVVKFGKLGDGEGWSFDGMPSDYVAKSWADYLDCPYGVPGDRLWVRENWAIRADQDQIRIKDLNPATPWYPADGETPSGCGGGMGKTRPSIHMPRWASRLTLEVTEARVQRVQDISEEDAEAEGCDFADKHELATAKDCFQELWDEINAKRPGASWDDNPWVWAVGFRRVKP